jgi:hypothetical protein
MISSLFQGTEDGFWSDDLDFTGVDEEEQRGGVAASLVGPLPDQLEVRLPALRIRVKLTLGSESGGLPG